MTSKEAAKNLLAGKTCDTCSRKLTDFPGKCKLPRGDITQGTIYHRDLAKYNTCLGWQEVWEIKYTSIPVTAKARKLNIKWSMASQLEMEPIDADVQKELIKRAKEELSGNKKP